MQILYLMSNKLNIVITELRWLYMKSTESVLKTSITHCSRNSMVTKRTFQLEHHGIDRPT